MSIQLATADGSVDFYFESNASVPQFIFGSDGTSNAVNVAFSYNTGSGFYSDLSYLGPNGSPQSIYLAFNSVNKYQFSGSGLFRAADDIVAFYSFSDRELKKDIRPICGSLALEKVQQLQGVYYTWKDDGGSRAGNEEIGFIAQEVESVIPQLVREHERLGQEGKYKSVDYEHLVALLVEAIKEQQKQIDELKAKVK